MRDDLGMGIGDAETGGTMAELLGQGGGLQLGSLTYINHSC